MATVPGPDDGSGLGRGQPNPPTPRLSAWIERNAVGPDRYTAAPCDATGIDLMSRWMTVPVDIVYDIEEMR